MTFTNTILWPTVNFALSDLVHYTGHRIVHAYPMLYKFIHKHHHTHGGRTPDRGWFDTSNAHPTDFLHTALSTCPISTLWLLPSQSVHVVGLISGCRFPWEF